MFPLYNRFSEKDHIYGAYLSCFIRSTDTLWKKSLLDILHVLFFCFHYKAAFKIVKGWLGPDAISMLKFTNKSDVQEYISGEYLPPHMGGTVSILTLHNPFVIS